MPTEKKVQAVEEMTETLSRSTVVIGAEYRGLDVAEATALRHAMREAGIEIKVIKNTLFLRAAEAAGMPNVGELAEGPTAIIYGFDDPIAPIKTVVEYQRQARNAFQARKAYLDGAIIPANQLADLASLPPWDVMIGQIAGALASPITNLVYLLSATLQEFSSLLDARAQQVGDDPASATAVAEAEPAAEAPEASADEAPAAEASAEAETVAEEESAAEASTEEATEDDSGDEAEASEDSTEEPAGSDADAEATENEAGEEKDGN
jgi:large subunit ribosomal protein L10